MCTFLADPIYLHTSVCKARPSVAGAATIEEGGLSNSAKATRIPRLKKKKKIPNIKVASNSLEAKHLCNDLANLHRKRLKNNSQRSIRE